MSTFNDLLYGGPRWALTTVARFKGGAGSSTTNTSGLPEYAEPYYTSLMEQSEALANQPYDPYTGERVSEFSGAQQQAMGGAEALYQQGNPTMDSAIQAGTYGTDAALQAAYNPNTLENSYAGAQNYGPLQANADQIGVGQFTDQVRDQYMSPYQEAVTQRSVDSAVLAAQEAQQYRNNEAIQAGAFGGDRRFIQDSIAERSLLDRLTGIQTSGAQSAFENAQQQYERDRSAQYGADAANQDANLRAMGMGEDSRQYGAGLTEQGNQFGASLESELGQFNNQYGLDAIQAALQGSDLLGQLGGMDQSAFLDRMSALGAAGDAQQDRQQQTLDTAYEDFINQRDYDRNSMTWLSGIMHGVPVSPESNVISYEAGPSGMSSAVGSGIAGLGLYNSLSE